MKKILLTIFCLLGIFGISETNAQAFFDNSPAPKLFTFGVRAGFNTSTRTFPVGNYYNHTMTSWGTGLNVGFVANMNFKEYLTLQPGFFLENRSGTLVNVVDYYSQDFNDGTGGYDIVEKTHYKFNKLRAFYITIPVMGVVKFNLAENIKWNVGFGPYLQFALSNSGEKNIQIVSGNPYDASYRMYIAQNRNFDVGFKMGMGLTFYQHYYIGVHYLAGLTNAWKAPAGGRNKSWMFSLGYNFE